MQHRKLRLRKPEVVHAPDGLVLLRQLQQAHPGIWHAAGEQRHVRHGRYAAGSLTLCGLYGSMGIDKADPLVEVLGGVYAQVYTLYRSLQSCEEEILRHNVDETIKSIQRGAEACIIGRQPDRRRCSELALFLPPNLVLARRARVGGGGPRGGGPKGRGGGPTRRVLKR